MPVSGRSGVAGRRCFPHVLPGEVPAVRPQPQAMYVYLTTRANRPRHSLRRALFAEEGKAYPQQETGGDSDVDA